MPSMSLMPSPNLPHPERRRPSTIAQGTHIRLAAFCLAAILLPSAALAQDADLLLEHGKIVTGELTDALVQSTSHFGIWLSATFDNSCDVIFAFGHVGAELGQVTDQKLLIGEELLIFHEIRDLVLTDSIGSCGS